MPRYVFVWLIFLTIFSLRVGNYLTNYKNTNGKISTKITGEKRSNGIYITNNAQLLLSEFRDAIYQKYMQYLPSPYTELLLGTVVGNDALKNVPQFKNALTITGTIHVVVVSGYNMTLIYSFISRIVGSIYSKRNIFIISFVMLIYAIFTGLQPPILRAMGMTMVLMFIKNSGRKVNTVLVIIFTSLLLCAVSPELIISKSFILSVLATLSLTIFDPFYKRLIVGKNKNNSAFLVDDLVASLSSLTLVWPYISYNFGTVSPLSPLYNMLLLWTIPYITVLGMVFTVIIFLQIELVSRIASLFVYPFLFIFVNGVEYFSGFKIAYLNYKIPFVLVVLYYAIIFTLYFVCARRKKLPQ